MIAVRFGCLIYSDKIHNAILFTDVPAMLESNNAHWSTGTLCLTIIASNNKEHITLVLSP